mmetsp:Transcript_21688/g.69234  ORF Transcript_21688/g.69234 Transcript_21688/m.69234 type:complete len:220 (-) Transcript_21688:266-925(-)
MCVAVASGLDEVRQQTVQKLLEGSHEVLDLHRLVLLRRESYARGEFRSDSTHNGPDSLPRQDVRVRPVFELALCRGHGRRAGRRDHSRLFRSVVNVCCAKQVVLSIVNVVSRGLDLIHNIWRRSGGPSPRARRGARGSCSGRRRRRRRCRRRVGAVLLRGGPLLGWGLTRHARHGGHAGHQWRRLALRRGRVGGIPLRGGLAWLRGLHERRLHERRRRL